MTQQKSWWLLLDDLTICGDIRHPVSVALRVQPAATLKQDRPRQSHQAVNQKGKPGVLPNKWTIARLLKGWAVPTNIISKQAFGVQKPLWATKFRASLLALRVATCRRDATGSAKISCLDNMCIDKPRHAPPPFRPLCLRGLCRAGVYKTRVVGVFACRGYFLRIFGPGLESQGST